MCTRSPIPLISSVKIADESEQVSERTVTNSLQRWDQLNAPS